MTPFEYGTIIGFASMTAFLWSLHRDMNRLSDRVSKIEGLLEGLRSAIEGRAAAKR